MIAPGRIDGNVVPTAIAAEHPSARMAGVEITAPPTPKLPDMTPVATPASAVNASRSSPESTLMPRGAGFSGSCRGRCWGSLRLRRWHANCRCAIGKLGPATTRCN